jgi:hypothetical protein
VPKAHNRFQRRQKSDRATATAIKVVGEDRPSLSWQEIRDTITADLR